MGSPVVQNIVVLGGLVVQIATLCYLIKYVRATAGIQKAAVAQTQASQELVNAANEQSEGLSKPALTLRATAHSPTIDENFTELVNRKMRMRAEPNADGCLVMINIGNGPALHVQYEIRDRAPQGGKPFTGAAAYVQAGMPMPLPLKSGNFIKGKHQKITCLYASLSGNRYESVIELKGDEIDNFSLSRRGRT
jgi:hypothetical protein